MRSKNLLISLAASAGLLLVLAFSTPAQTGQTVPLYRLYSEATGANFYTVDKTRKAEAIASGWVSKGIATYVLGGYVPGSAPLYVLVMPLQFGIGKGHVFNYTTSPFENDTFLKTPYIPTNLGGGYEFISEWRNDGTGIAAYVAPMKLPGTVPLYRLRHAADVVKASPLVVQQFNLNHSRDTFLTTDEKEQAFYIKTRGYQLIDIVGYVWPEAGQVSLTAPSSSPVPKIATGKAKDADTDLLERGCTRSSLGNYLCSTPGTYAICQSYANSGRVHGCHAGAGVDVAAQKAMDDKLFSVGCTRFLGRPDEYICKTPNAINTCQPYADKKQIKLCRPAKQ